jgi:hypothetical protein
MFKSIIPLITVGRFTALLVISILLSILALTGPLMAQCFSS